MTGVTADDWRRCALRIRLQTLFKLAAGAAGAKKYVSADEPATAPWTTVKWPVLNEWQPQDRDLSMNFKRLAVSIRLLAISSRNLRNGVLRRVGSGEQREIGRINGECKSRMTKRTAMSLTSGNRQSDSSPLNTVRSGASPRLLSE